jgi:O-antigen ligase
MFKNIAIAALYVGLVSVVVVATSTFFPFIGGKYYFFRIATDIALAATVLWWAFEAPAGELKKRITMLMKNPVWIAVSVFVGSFIISALLADNPHGAWWSNFERGEGGFQMIHYYAWFVLMVLLFDTLRQWRIAFMISIGAAVGVIGYGVLAAAGQPGFIGPYAGSQNSVWKDIFSANRFQGSLGNPAYVAPYLMFAMTYAGWLLMEEKNKWGRVGYGLLGVLFFIFFILAQTKGAFVGFGAGIVVGLLYLAVTNQKVKRIAIAVLVVSVLMYTGLLTIRKSLIEKNVPGARLLDISFGADTLQTRTWTWQSAWEGFKERPVFGWGPENFSTVFDKHFNKNHFDPNRNTETWFDRAHSVVFDYLAETGIVGLVAYISMVVVIIKFILVDIKERLQAVFKQDTTIKIAQALLLSAMVAYIVQALALFDVLPIYINVFLVAAFVAYLSQKGRVSTEKTQ